MTNLTLNDGSTVLLMKETDLEELIEERLGNDVRIVIEELRREANYTEKKVNSDLDGYEAEAESLRVCLSDLRDSLLEMKELMNEPKVPKIKLFKRILNAIDLIENNY